MRPSQDGAQRPRCTCSFSVSDMLKFQFQGSGTQNKYSKKSQPVCGLEITVLPRLTVRYLERIAEKLFFFFIISTLLNFQKMKPMNKFSSIILES